MSTSTGIAVPEFLTRIERDFNSRVAHVFVVYGNVNDYSDNSPSSHRGPGEAIALLNDNNLRRQANTAPLVAQGNRQPVNAVAAQYNLTLGLTFFHADSKKSFEEFIKKYVPAEELKKWPDSWIECLRPEIFYMVMNRVQKIQAKIQEENLRARQLNGVMQGEMLLTLIITDPDVMFKDGDIAPVDRNAVVHIRNWARESMSNHRSFQVVLLTRSLADIHESIRSLPRVASVQIPKPNLDDRRQWISSFIEIYRNADIRTLADKIEPFADGFGIDQFAIQSAGMSRAMIQATILRCLRNKEKIDYPVVRTMKQRSIEDEYGGLVEFEEPSYGFEQIGGHEHLKRYFRNKVVEPMLKGDLRRVSSGALLLGPPGTGKTVLAMALAKESRMNFLLAHINRVFGGLVGETEMKMNRLLEAIQAAEPCLVFMDEIDSLGLSRTSVGDSGTSARVFNSLMTYLSDESRKGKVCVIAASNRPDYLDDAFIRAGRFDAKLPALPPFKGDAAGRLAILNALAVKHSIKMHKSLADTVKGDRGLGMLLNNKERIWTGAEIEVVMKYAFDLAYQADRKTRAGAQDLSITQADWEQAMDDVVPNTGAIERQTLLALYFCDILGYMPPEWKERARDKEALKADLLALGVEVNRQ